MLRSIIKAFDHEKLEDNEALHEATSQRLMVEMTEETSGNVSIQKAANNKI